MSLFEVARDMKREMGIGFHPTFKHAAPQRGKSSLGAKFDDGETFECKYFAYFAQHLTV